MDKTITLNDVIRVDRLRKFFKKEISLRFKNSALDLKMYLFIAKLLMERISQIVSFYNPGIIFSNQKMVLSKHFIINFLVFHGTLFCINNIQ